ncbi:MAG: MFS transporter [Clostridia bacterium]|nr:MFS transporter [Clostridia bacterium]
MKKHSIKQLHSFLLLWGSQAVSQLGTAMTDYAIIIWVYSRKGTASSVTLLTVCTFLPTIFFRFLAGSAVDRWNKKRTMLTADLLAACGSLAVLALHSADALQIWHLYVINFLLSLMNAFQEPASFVAVSMLVPKEHYARAGGLQGFSGAAVSILAPALGALLVASGGLELVLIVDLATFAVAFLALLLLIRIPEAERKKTEEEPFSKTCLAGIRYLKEHTAILRITLFLAVINFLAKLGNDGMLSPFILGRTGNNQPVLGAVESFVALGLLAGSLITTMTKPVKKRIPLIFTATGLVFAGNVIQSLTSRPWLWCAAAFASYLLAAVMNVNLDAIMRERVPVEMQGRVFSAKSTLQNFTIPIALLLGGLLADTVFEPFMLADSPAQRFLSGFFGTGKGAGIGLMFFIVGIAGMLVSFTRLRKPAYRELDRTETETIQTSDEIGGNNHEQQ